MMMVIWQASASQIWKCQGAFLTIFSDSIYEFLSLVTVNTQKKSYSNIVMLFSYMGALSACCHGYTAK